MTIPFAIEIANVSIAKPTAIKTIVNTSIVAPNLICLELRIHRYMHCLNGVCQRFGRSDMFSSAFSEVSDFQVVVPTYFWSNHAGSA